MCNQWPIADGWANLVFVDGKFADDLSSVPADHSSIQVGSLSKAIASDTVLARQHLSRYAEVDNDGFIALNTAFLSEGVYVHIPDGTHVEPPIHLLFLTTGGDAPDDEPADARAEIPADTSNVETLAAQPEELPEEISLSYSVVIASFSSFDDALTRQREWATTGTAFYVAPTVVRGVVS